jgi:hypothetical protein
MALRTVFKGSGLGIKPVSLGDDPYSADSDFDSTVRINVKPRATAPPRETALAAALGPPRWRRLLLRLWARPRPSQGNRPPLWDSGGVGPSLPTSYSDPTRLNFEGMTGQQLLAGGPDAQTTSTSYNPDIHQLSGMVQQLQDFTGIRLDADWRTQLSSDPEAFLRRVQAIALDPNAAKAMIESQGGHYDTTMRNRINAWYQQLTNAVRQLKTGANPEYQKLFLGQEAYNRGLERLKQSGAQGSREDEEALLSQLAEHGILDSGIAARELTKLRTNRLSNYYDAAANMNQQLLSGELGRLTQSDLQKQASDLNLRNQLAIPSTAAAIHQDNQPDFWSQLLGTGLGVGASFLPSSPRPRTAIPSSTRSTTRGRTSRWQSRISSKPWGLERTRWGCRTALRARPRNRRRLSSGGFATGMKLRRALADAKRLKSARDQFSSTLGIDYDLFAEAPVGRAEPDPQEQGPDRRPRQPTRSSSSVGRT